MTPAARHQAAIEVLDAMAQQALVAEQALLKWSRGARYAGSTDRAAVRDIVFSVLRARNSCEILGNGSSGRCLVLGALRLWQSDPSRIFTGDTYAPERLNTDERHWLQQPWPELPCDVPAWLVPVLRDSLGDELDLYLETMRHRAQIFLRVNPRKTTPEMAIQTLEEEGISTRRHPSVPGALHVTAGERKIQQSKAFATGMVELQDAGSQALVLQMGVERWHRVLDYCAGGGGKALAIAPHIDAPVVAHDASKDRMKDIPTRARRAGVQIDTTIRPAGTFDLVLCDVPCSGSGTWRRTPDAKWRITPYKLHDLNAQQTDIIENARHFVGPEGRLIYVTCSVLRQENEEVVYAFVKKHPDWNILRCENIRPSELGDGFFLGILSRHAK